MNLPKTTPASAPRTHAITPRIPAIPPKKLVDIATTAYGATKWLHQTGPDKAVWTTDRARATHFALAKMDKAAVAYFEKCVGCPITLWPI